MFTDNNNLIFNKSDKDCDALISNIHIIDKETPFHKVNFSLWLYRIPHNWGYIIFPRLFEIRSKTYNVAAFLTDDTVSYHRIIKSNIGVYLHAECSAHSFFEILNNDNKHKDITYFYIDQTKLSMTSFLFSAKLKQEYGLTLFI